MTDNDNESVIVKLTRMEGKLDLSNLRHDQTDSRLGVLDARISGHADRISGIENREFVKAGERKSLSTAGGIVWALIGSIIGGGGLTIAMRLLGH